MPELFRQNPAMDSVGNYRHQRPSPSDFLEMIRDAEAKFLVTLIYASEAHNDDQMTKAKEKVTEATSLAIEGVRMAG